MLHHTGAGELIIRKATETDLPTLLEFEQAIVTAERPFDHTLKDGEIHYYDLTTMIGDENVQVVVAELAGEVIGSGYARMEWAKPYQQYEKYAYLGFMYVKSGYRGKGVNIAIVEVLKEWCRLKNITELRLEVYTDNQPALKAYEKAGFTPILLWMRLGL